MEYYCHGSRTLKLSMNPQKTEDNFEYCKEDIHV